MTTTPILGLTELASAQAVPEVIVNENTRWLEFFASGGGIIDRDVADESTLTPSDGDAYLVAASATDDWTGHDGEIALYISTAWEFKEPVEGMSLYVSDEDVRIDYDGAAWNEAGGGGGGGSAPVATESGTTYDLAAADVGKYIRFTSGSAKTVSVRDETDEALPANGEWHIRNVGANNLTLDEDTAVTINPPADGTLVVPPGGTVTLKRVAEDEFDLFGVTVPA